MTIGRRRLLLIDDDPVIRNAISSALRDSYLVSVAHDGVDGLTKALTWKPDIVVCDNEMPGWNGIETIEKFQQNPALRGIPIVMMSADSKRGVAQAAHEAGARGYVRKDAFDKDDFCARLDAIMNGHLAVH
ncbi:MAG TPA: response regulator [Planctomycetaceae bacterium]|nr:response regulator [Planctomycetaceae bacterium]